MNRRGFLFSLFAAPLVLAGVRKASPFTYGPDGSISIRFKRPLKPAGPIWVRILPIDVPSPETGFVYQRHEIEANIQRRGSIMGQIGVATAPLSLDKVSHCIQNLRIEDGWLIGDLHLYHTEEGAKLRTILASGAPLKFVASGVGRIRYYRSGKQVIHDYLMDSINIEAAME